MKHKVVQLHLYLDNNRSDIDIISDIKVMIDWKRLSLNISEDDEFYIAIIDEKYTLSHSLTTMKQLPREIIDDIITDMNTYVDEYMYHSLWMKKILKEHLWPYLSLPQEQEEPMDMKNHRTVILWYDKWAKLWDMSCEVHWYYRDWQFYITNVKHMEQEAPIEKIEIKKEIEQSLEKIFMLNRQIDELYKYISILRNKT